MPTLRPRTLGLVFALAFAPAVGAAQEGASIDPDEAERRAAGIIRTTQSPFCPGQTLDSCPSGRAGEWRTDIRTWTAEGVDPQEIRRRLQERVPGFELSNRPLGTAPLFAAVGVLSLVALVVVARRIVGRKAAPGASAGGAPGAAAAAPAAAAPRDEYDDRLDEELQRL